MMKGGMAGLMKQAQQMQEKMQKMQEELANAEVTGQSGAGLVSVVMTGRHDVRRVTIDESLLTEDKEVLEDLIAAAVNDAVRKVEKNSQEKMAGRTAGLNLPDGFTVAFSAGRPSNELLPADPSVARRPEGPARGRSQNRTAHGAAPACTQPRGGAAAGPCTGSGDGWGGLLLALPHPER